MKVFLMLPLVLAPLLAVPAAAQTRVEVPYHDLDLTRPAAITVLDERLVRAARRACPVEAPLRADSVGKQSKCRADALIEARNAARNATAMAQARAAVMRDGA